LAVWAAQGGEPGVQGKSDAICVQEYRDNKSKPDEMARNQAVYDPMLQGN
jgi:hypothetical protein